MGDGGTSGTDGERVSAYLERVAGIVERIKVRRGVSLDQPLPGGRGRWNRLDCGVAGCRCHHRPSWGCDRGWSVVTGAATASGVHVEGHLHRRCTACRAAAEHAEALRGAGGGAG